MRSAAQMEITWYDRGTSVYAESIPNLVLKADWGESTSISGNLPNGFSNQILLNSAQSAMIPIHLPSFSTDNVVRFPHIPADFDTEVLGTGTLGLRGINGDAMTSGGIWIGAASDFVFHQHLLIPKMRFYASPWALDEAVAQMDGVKSDAPERDLVRSSKGGPQHVGIGEKQQSFVSMAEDWQYVDTIPWTTADALGDVLYIGNFPYFGIGALNGPAFSSFSFFRAGMRVKVQLDSLIYQQGKLVMVFLPGLKVSDVSAMAAFATRNLLFASHAFIYAGGSREVIFDIPWFFAVNYLDLSFDASSGPAMGTFAIIVINPMSTGGATSTTAYMNISASFTNPEFLIRLPHPDPSRLLRWKAKPPDDDEKDFEVVAQGGSFSRFHGESFVNVGLSGLTNLSHAPISKASTHAAFSRSEGATCPGPGPTIGTLTRTPMMVDPMVWTVGDGIGTVLGTFPLTIAPTGFVVDTSSTEQDEDVTSMEYASVPFDQWRCKALNFRLEFIATRFHTGRVVVVTKYGSVQAPPTTIGEAMSQYAQIIDVASINNVHEIVVPFVCERNWLHVPKRAPEAGQEYRACYGNIYVMVLNELQGIDAVSTTVDVNVYVSASGVEFRGQSLATQTIAIDMVLYNLSKGKAKAQKRGVANAAARARR